MYDLSKFGLEEMIESGKHIRALSQGSASMQQAAGRIVDFLYDDFRITGTRAPCCTLVRCFKTHPFGELPTNVRRIACTMMPNQEPVSSMRCLTLLASRGEHPDWNSPSGSSGHRAIPLPSAEIVAKAPMIARLIAQLGLTVKQVISPEPDLLLDRDEQPFNVFHVEDALGSEFIPAQRDFVVPFGVRSAIGFGGILPAGDLFVIVNFTKVRVTRETASLFRTLALSAKLALLPFAGGRVFDE